MVLAVHPAFPRVESVLILLKAHQCFLTYIPPADGAVALSRTWFVSTWFLKETRSQLGQQKKPPGIVVIWYKLLGGASQPGSPQTEAPKSRGCILKAIWASVLTRSGELLEDAHVQQPRFWGSWDPSWPPHIFSIWRTKMGEPWSWKLQCLLMLDS